MSTRRSSVGVGVVRGKRTIVIIVVIVRFLMPSK